MLTFDEDFGFNLLSSLKAEESDLALKVKAKMRAIAKDGDLF